MVHSGHTLIVIGCSDCQNSVMEVLVLVNVRLVQRLFEVGRMDVLVSDSGPDKFRNWNQNQI